MEEEDSYDDENKQKWEFRKVWTQVVEPLLTLDDITSEDVARAIVRAAFHEGCKIVDEGNVVPLVFKPTNVKMREDKSTEIIGVKFKPGRQDNLGKRWRLIAKNSLADFLHPTMSSENRPDLKNELIVVVNGVVDESSQHIILDQDEQETKIIFLSTSLSTESELRCFRQMSQDFFLDWYFRVKGREKIVSAVPLPFIILPVPEATPTELQQQHCRVTNEAGQTGKSGSRRKKQETSSDEEEESSDSEIEIISNGKKGSGLILGGVAEDCNRGKRLSSTSKEELDSDETVTGHGKQQEGRAKKSGAHDDSEEIFSTPPTSPITSHVRSTKVAKRISNGVIAAGNERTSDGSDCTECIVLSDDDVEVIEDALSSPSKDTSDQPAKSNLEMQEVETSADAVLVSRQRRSAAKGESESPASVSSPRSTKGATNTGSPTDPSASRKKMSSSSDSNDRQEQRQVLESEEEGFIESESDEETFVPKRRKRGLRLRKPDKTRSKKAPRGTTSGGHDSENIDGASLAEKVTYESLKDLADELSIQSGSLYKRNVYGLVVQVMKTPEPDSDGYCTTTKRGTFELRISDLTKSNVFVRICTVKYSDVNPNINMQAGPTIHVGDIIRIHRATVQFEVQGRVKQLVVSTAPHGNYTLFDGKDGPLEASCRRLSKKLPSITEVDRKRVKDLRNFLKDNAVASRNSRVEEVNHSLNVTPEKGQTKGVAAEESGLNPGNNTESIQHPPAEQPKATMTVDEHHENHSAVPIGTPMILESQATIIDTNPGKYILMSDDEPADESPDKNAGESCGDLTFKSSIPVPKSGIYLIKHPKNPQRLRIDRVEHIDPSDDKSYNLFIKVLDVEVLKTRTRDVVLLRVQDLTIPSCSFHQLLVTEPPDYYTIDIEVTNNTDPELFLRLSVHLHEPLLLTAVQAIKPNGRGIPMLKMEMKDIFFLH